MPFNVFDRYQQDPAFKNLVDMMTAVIMQGGYTPSEVRLAAVHACVRVENLTFRSRRFIMTEDDVDALGLTIIPRSNKGG